MFRGNILLIDKFNGMNTLIAGYLTASGFQVDCMRSPQELTDQKLTTAHLALLDIGTAGDGLRDILERLNAAGVPAVVLTSEQDMSGRLTALEMGHGGAGCKDTLGAVPDASCVAVCKPPSGEFRRTYGGHCEVQGHT